jgi:hypothetical protein
MELKSAYLNFATENVSGTIPSLLNDLLRHGVDVKLPHCCHCIDNWHMWNFFDALLAG